MNVNGWGAAARAPEVLEEIPERRVLRAPPSVMADAGGDRVGGPDPSEGAGYPLPLPWDTGTGGGSPDFT